MTSPHLIRLRGPWERAIAGTVARISLPGDWLAEIPPEVGKTIFTRQFNRPTNLDANSIVNLCWQDLPEDVCILLNGQRIPHSNRNILSQLALRNRLQITIASDSPRPVLGEVWLELA